MSRDFETELGDILFPAIANMFGFGLEDALNKTIRKMENRVIDNRHLGSKR